MSDDRNFMKRLGQLLEEYDGDPEEVFRALEINGDSDEDNLDDSDGDDNLFDLDTALEAVGEYFRLYFEYNMSNSFNFLYIFYQKMILKLEIMSSMKNRLPVNITVFNLSKWT